MLNKTFTANRQRSPNKGLWAYLVWPGSVRYFGAHGLVKISGKTTDRELSVGTYVAGNPTTRWNDQPRAIGGSESNVLRRQRLVQYC